MHLHLIRSSLKYVPRREREQVARDLKPIYTALDPEAAHAGRGWAGWDAAPV
jgi:transposase-like protein